MSGSIVHDLSLFKPFVRSPNHLWDHYCTVKPVLPSRIPPIKQQDMVPWRATCVSGMRVLRLKVSVKSVNHMSELLYDTSWAMTLCGFSQVSTSVPSHPPYVAAANVFLCRPATPASASRDSSSARCRPTASVSASRTERLHKLCPSPQRDVNAEHHKMKKIRLFMPTGSVVLDNSTVAIQKAANAAVFPYLMVKALARHCLRWATAHADWIQSLDFGNKQCWNTVLPWVWSLFLLSSAVAFCFLLQMWTSVTLTRAKGRVAASTLTVPTPVSVTVATARYSRRTGSSVKVSHSKWQQRTRL